MGEYIRVGRTEFHVDTCKAMKKAEFFSFFKGRVDCDLNEAWRLLHPERMKKHEKSDE